MIKTSKVEEEEGGAVSRSQHIMCVCVCVCVCTPGAEMSFHLSLRSRRDVSFWKTGACQ